jgi:hypothetical protein
VAAAAFGHRPSRLPTAADMSHWRSSSATSVAASRPALPAIWCLPSVSGCHDPCADHRCRTEADLGIGAVVNPCRQEMSDIPGLFLLAVGRAGFDPYAGFGTKSGQICVFENQRLVRDIYQYMAVNLCQVYAMCELDELAIEYDKRAVFCLSAADAVLRADRRLWEAPSAGTVETCRRRQSTPPVGRLSWRPRHSSGSPSNAAGTLLQRRAALPCLAKEKLKVAGQVLIAIRR